MHWCTYPIVRCHTHNMKQSILGILIILFGLSCTEESTDDNPINKQEVKNQAEIISYYPETLKTIIEDTTIQDSLRLIIETKSSDSTFVKQSWELNSDTMLVQLYRDNIVNLTLKNKGNLILSTELKKELLFETMPSEFMDQSIIILAWYEDFNNQSGEIKLRMNVCVPESDYCYLYSIYAFTTGDLRIEMEEIH